MKKYYFRNFIVKLSESSASQGNPSPSNLHLFKNLGKSHIESSYSESHMDSNPRSSIH